MAVSDHMEWARQRVRSALEHGATERVVAVLVGSLDLAAAVDGRTRALTSDADRALLRAWREVADALLVGKRTLEAELYSGAIVPADARQRRSARGARPAPPLVTIDRSGTLDLDLSLRGADPPALLVYVPPGHRKHDGRATWLELAEPTVAHVLADVRRRLGARIIVAEGGPTLLGAALEEGAITDISLTIAPLSARGGPRLWDPALDPAPGTELLAADEVDGHLFTHRSLAAVPTRRLARARR